MSFSGFLRKTQQSRYICPQSHRAVILFPSSEMIQYHDRSGQRVKRAPAGKRDIDAHPEKEHGGTKHTYRGQLEPVIIRSFLLTTLQQTLLLVPLILPLQSRRRRTSSSIVLIRYLRCRTKLSAVSSYAGESLHYSFSLIIPRYIGHDRICRSYGFTGILVPRVKWSRDTGFRQHRGSTHLQ